MKKFTINCDFGGQMAPFVIYIGKPELSHNPIHFQTDWVQKQRGGTVPQEIVSALAELEALAIKNHVPLEELCVYALGCAEEKTAIDQKEIMETSEGERNSVTNIENDTQ